MCVYSLFPLPARYRRQAQLFGATTPPPPSVELPWTKAFRARMASLESLAETNPLVRRAPEAFAATMAV